MAQQKCSVKLGTSVFPPIQLLERNCRTSKRQKYFKQYSIRGIFMLAGNMVFHENKKHLNDQGIFKLTQYENLCPEKDLSRDHVYSEILLRK